MSRVNTSKTLRLSQLAEEIRQAKGLENRPELVWHPVEGWVEGEFDEEELKSFVAKHKPDPKWRMPGWKRRLKDLLDKDSPTEDEAKEQDKLLRQYVKELLSQEEDTSV